jgi:hypothetical protein
MHRHRVKTPDRPEGCHLHLRRRHPMTTMKKFLSETTSLNKKNHGWRLVEI